MNFIRSMCVHYGLWFRAISSWLIAFISVCFVFILFLAHRLIAWLEKSTVDVFYRMTLQCDSILVHIWFYPCSLLPSPLLPHTLRKTFNFSFLPIRAWTHRQIHRFLEYDFSLTTNFVCTVFGVRAMVVVVCMCRDSVVVGNESIVETLVFVYFSQCMRTCDMFKTHTVLGFSPFRPRAWGNSRSPASL